ncbi:MAG TPA: hypothetical protein PLO51_00875 [Candidatus Micrarchaeota archaeon]|nr:hypothetical protein [Candidatus Micrarchaeota archaeon]
MAKPIEYITELTEKEARIFLADLNMNKKNTNREATLKRAKETFFTII